MAHEERVLAMVQAGTISEDEGERLLAALRAHRRELPGWRVLFTPMEFLSTRAAWTVAVIVTTASVFVSRLGIRFDGALDLHRVSRPPAWSVVALDAAIGIVLTAAVLWLASLAVARGVRLIDFVLAVALARAAQVAGGITAWLVIPADIQATVVKALASGTGMDPWLALPSMLVVPFFVWFLVLLYQSFLTAAGLEGFSAGLTFTVGIVVAEVLSKLALLGTAAVQHPTLLHPPR
jgi:hypothetical protein